MDGIFIQDRFSIPDDSSGSIYSDALILPIDEYNALSEKEVTLLKQARFDNWKQALEDAQNQPPPSKEEALADITAEIEAKRDDLARLEETKAAIESKADLDVVVP